MRGLDQRFDRHDFGTKDKIARLLEKQNEIATRIDKYQKEEQDRIEKARKKS